MEDYQPQFGGKADIMALLMLLIVGATIGLAAGSAVVYDWIQHGALDRQNVSVTTH